MKRRSPWRSTRSRIDLRPAFLASSILLTTWPARFDLLLRRFHDHVAGFQPLFGGRAVLGDIDDNDALSSLSENFSFSSGVTFDSVMPSVVTCRVVLERLVSGSPWRRPARSRRACRPRPRGLVLSLAPDRHRHGLADRGLGDQPRQVPHVVDRLAVEAEDHVARLDAAGLRRAVVVDAGDQRALRLIEPEALGDFVGDRLDAHPEPAAPHRVVGLADQFTATSFARFDGIAKPMPIEPPLGE